MRKTHIDDLRTLRGLFGDPRRIATIDRSYFSCVPKDQSVVKDLNLPCFLRGYHVSAAREELRPERAFSLGPPHNFLLGCFQIWENTFGPGHSDDERLLASGLD